MREIKFCAWDKENNMMFYFDFTDVLQNTLCYDGFDDEDNELNKSISLDKCVVMQYTGLKDKSGKDIYFDCSIITDGMVTTTVKWNMWSLLDDIENGIGDWKIIGNIYENHELIK